MKSLSTASKSTFRNQMFERHFRIATDKCLLSLKSKAVLNTSSESGNAIPKVQQNFLLAESPGLNELCNL